jgi:hypothetical protein
MKKDIFKRARAYFESPEGRRAFRENLKKAQELIDIMKEDGKKKFNPLRRKKINFPGFVKCAIPS